MNAGSAARRVVSRSNHSTCLQRCSSSSRWYEAKGRASSAVDLQRSQAFAVQFCAKWGQSSPQRQVVSRSYATARPNPALRKAASDPWLQFVADMARCPGLSLQEVQPFVKEAGSLGYDSDALVYTKCADEYLKAIESGARHPNIDLTDRPNIDAAIMCETAALLVRQPVNRKLGIGMFIAAASLDYHPAIINLALVMSRDKTWRASRMSTPYESKYQSLVRLGKDPNALTVDGWRKMNDDDFAGAQRSFQKALSIGGEGFSLESSLYLWLGQILRKQGNTAEAQEYLQRAVDAGSIEWARASFELGEILLPTNEEEAVQNFYNAGLYGVSDGYGRLTDIELARAKEASDKDRAAHHRAWAMEWKRLQENGK